MMGGQSGEGGGGRPSEIQKQVEDFLQRAHREDGEVTPAEGRVRVAEGRKGGLTWQRREASPTRRQQSALECWRGPQPPEGRCPRVARSNPQCEWSEPPEMCRAPTDRAGRQSKMRRTKPHHLRSGQGEERERERGRGLTHKVWCLKHRIETKLHREDMERLLGGVPCAEFLLKVGGNMRGEETRRGEVRETDMVLVQLAAHQGVFVALLDIAEVESAPAAEEGLSDETELRIVCS
jgi:hypothetical protein